MIINRIRPESISCQLFVEFSWIPARDRVERLAVLWQIFECEDCTVYTVEIVESDVMVVEESSMDDKDSIIDCCE